MLDAALPLRRRWTDPTPVTAEALAAAGWGSAGTREPGSMEWHRRLGCRSYRVVIYRTGAAYFGSAWLKNATIPLETMGQLNMIVDALKMGGEA